MKLSWLWVIVPLGAVVVVGLAALAVVLPPLLVEGGLNSTDRTKQVGDLRTALIAILGGVAVGAGTIVAAMSLAETQRQNRIGAKHNREQLELQRRGQVTDRFTKAIDQLGQLGDDKLDVRLGAIYALEQIAKDSEDMHWPVMQVLSEYVREHSPEQTIQEEHLMSLQQHGRQRTAYKFLKSSPLSWQARPDLLAVANVIRRRRWEWDPVGVVDESGRRWRQPLDLSYCDLRGADLSTAHLEWASFSSAHLEMATSFTQTKLEGAFFTEAQLSGNSFEQALAQNTYFEAATLWEVSFWDADLRGACFREAHFRGGSFRNARLAGSDFGGAELEWTDLRGVDLSETHGITQEQLDVAICDETTEPPPALRVDVTCSEMEVEAKKSARARAVAIREGRWKGEVQG